MSYVSSFFYDRFKYTGNHKGAILTSAITGLGIPTGLYYLFKTTNTLATLVRLGASYPYIASPMLGVCYWLSANLGELIGSAIFGHAPIDEEQENESAGIRQFLADKLLYARSHKIEMILGSLFGLWAPTGLFYLLRDVDSLSFFVKQAAEYPMIAFPLLGLGYWFFANVGELAGSAWGHTPISEREDELDQPLFQNSRNSRAVRRSLNFN